MKIVFKYLKPYVLPVIISIVMLVGQVYCELTLPNLMSDLVNEIIQVSATGGTANDYIKSMGLEMVGVAVLAVVCAITVGYISSVVAAKVSMHMRKDLFRKVNDFSNAELDKFSTASLITRNTNDVTQVQNFVTMGLKMMMFAPLMGVGSIVMALQKSTSLAGIVFVAVLVIIGVLLIVMVVALPKFKILQTYVDKLNLVSREELSGLMVIRAFGNEPYEEERFDKANQDLTFTTRFVQRTIASLMPMVTLIMSGVSVAVIWFGSKAVGNFTLEIGDLLAFIQYAMHIMISFIFVSMIFIIFPRAQVAANRIKAVLECEVTINDKENAEELKDVKGLVEFSGVHFKYGNASDDVLEDISFVAEPGKTTAFIGATGSGKSTLINLIPRFYDVTEGSIKIDGHDIRDVKLHDLRDAIGYIPQKAFLFSGTIESNIKYGNETEDIRPAIEVAQAAEFVDSKPEGIELEIAQGATNVSGGQKQRLSIARALAKKPPIYIFDDSFSALDFKTDAALRKALAEYTGESTVLIVAQRVSTIMNADQIIVLDEGKIVGKGTHKELIASCPAYLEICESQLAKEEI